MEKAVDGGAIKRGVRIRGPDSFEWLCFSISTANCDPDDGDCEGLFGDGASSIYAADRTLFFGSTYCQ